MKDALKTILVKLGLFSFLCGLIGLRQRLFPPDIAGRYLASHKVKKLQIGSGINVYEGWVNTDYEPVMPGTLQMDATKRFPFEDNTFDYVFCQHMIEHIGYEDGQFMLGECLRVLKPGGKVRISTPNLAFVCGLYTDEPTDRQKAYIEWSKQTWVPGVPKATAAFVVNNFFRNWGHQFIYDEPTLREAIERAGFADVRGFPLNGSDDPVFRDLENAQRLPEGFLAMETISFEGTKA